MKNRKQMLAAIQEALKRKTIRQNKETKAVADLVLYAIDLAIDEEERMMRWWLNMKGITNPHESDKSY